MASIIAVCKREKIAMIASFDIPTEENPDLRCTSALLGEGYDPGPGMNEALNAIRGRRAFHPLVLTTKDKDGKVISSEVVLP